MRPPIFLGFALWTALIALTGCAQVASQVQFDANSAAAMANNPAIQKFSPGAAARATCWMAIGAMAGGLVPATPPPGVTPLPLPIAPSVEAGFEAQDLARSPECQPVIAGVAMWALSKAPGANFLPITP